MTLILHHTHDPICSLCEQKLSHADAYLQTWFRAIVKSKFPNAHISWSYRDEKDQEEAFENGKSKLKFPHSAHNKTPALALDLFQIDESGHAFWDPGFFSAVYELCLKTSPKMIWGAHFRDLGDSDHFEYRA